MHTRCGGPFLFIFGHAAWQAGSSFPNQGSNLCRLHSVLTVGPPEKSPFLFLTRGHLARQPEGNAHQFTPGAHLVFIFSFYFFMFWGHKSRKVLVSGARDRILAPCGGSGESNPWTSRAVPAQLFFKAGCTLEGEASAPHCSAVPGLCSRGRADHVAGLHRQGGPARPLQACPRPPDRPAASPRSPGTPVPGSCPRAPCSGLSFLETQLWGPLTPHGPGHAPPPPGTPGLPQGCGAYPGM